MKAKLVVTVMVLVGFSACRAGDPELVSPEMTVLSYCSSGFHDIDSKYFAIDVPDGAAEVYQRLPWKTCRITKQGRTSLAGKTIEGRIVLTEDVEIITAAATEGGSRELKYWYLLREFDNEWKIIAYSSIDEPQFIED